MRLIIIDDIADRLDMLEAVLERGRAAQVQAICVLGHLRPADDSAPAQATSAQTFQAVGQLLRQGPFPSFLIPGPRDTPLADLEAALHGPLGDTTLRCVHGVAAPLGQTAIVAGYGGIVGEKDVDTPDALEVPATRVAARFHEIAAYNPNFQFAQHRIFLIGRSTGIADPAVAATIQELVERYRPSLICTSDLSRGPTVERRQNTLIVTPGSLAAGSYLVADLDLHIVDVARLDAPPLHSPSAPPAEILVPLDDAPLSAQILPVVGAYARAMGQQLRLLHVLPEGFDEVTDAASQSTPHTYLGPTGLGAAAQFFLDSAAQPLRAAGLHVATEVASGDIATAILARARARSQTRAIAMATTAGRLHGHWPLGSVAQRVLHETPVPMLLLHGLSHPGPRAEPGRLNTVLVPLDGSDEAAMALPEVYTIATTTGASLVLLAVTPSAEDLAAIGEGVPYGMVEQAVREHTALLMSYLMREAGQLKQAGLHVRARVTHGLPAASIVRAAHEEDADLIVMATHGRGGWHQLLIGSIALSVLLAAQRPVMLVRCTTQEAPAQQPGLARCDEDTSATGAQSERDEHELLS